MTAGQITMLAEDAIKAAVANIQVQRKEKDKYSICQPSVQDHIIYIVWTNPQKTVAQ